MKKVYWACKHICMLNWFDSFWLTSSTHSWINLSCFLILGIRHSSSDKSLQRFQEAHFRYSRKKGAVFFGKIQIRISESKIWFCIFGGKSKNGSWIHKIHTLEGFFGSNPNQEVWDSQSGRFFFEQKWHTTVVVYLHSYTVFKPFLRHVFCMYVVSAYAGKKKNSSATVLNSYDFTILRCILFEKCLGFKPKCMHFVYSFVVYFAFPSCLRREDQFVVYFV